MERLLSIAMLVGACAPLPPTAAEGAQRRAPVSVAAIRGGEVALGAVVTVGEALVLSGRTADGVSVWVQDPETGEGLEVRAGASLPGWPPPVGTPVSLRLYLVGPAEAPVAWLQRDEDLAVLGPPRATVVRREPKVPRPFDLVRFDDVVVLSEPDPLGRAALSNGVELDGRFGASLPGLGNRGRLTGLVTADLRLAPRVDADWLGERAAGVILDVTLADVRAGAVPEGVTVRVFALQGTSWSHDGRALLQDEAGDGVWLDTEGWGAPATEMGDLAVFTAQVSGSRLRSWWGADLVGEATPRIGDAVVEGALVEVEVSGLGPVDPLGERTTSQGWLLDDRFLDLVSLPDPAIVRAAVEEREETRLAVFEVR